MSSRYYVRPLTAKQWNLARGGIIKLCGTRQASGVYAAVARLEYLESRRRKR